MYLRNLLFSSVFSTLFLIPSIQACTRAVFIGDNNTVVTGRSMDWVEDTQSELWLMPRGIKRTGENGDNTLTWTSQYGSVITSAYNLASADGMNEKGLVMNMLYLAESNYGEPAKDKPSLSINIWGQYVLDNFATVDEAVAGMSKTPFYIVATPLPNGKASTLHLSLSDPSGDSAILEYIDGTLVIHHSKEYQVMTNSPVFSKQLAINEYWQNIDGTVFLPGTNRASDRFARTSFYMSAIPKQVVGNLMTSSPDRSFSYQAIIEVLSVMRSVSVPFGITDPKAPNIASTLWRTISDQKNLMYYFDSAVRPNTFWVSFEKLNFTSGAPIQRLAMSKGEIYAGEASVHFKATKPFAFFTPQDSTATAPITKK